MAFAHYKVFSGCQKYLLQIIKFKHWWFWHGHRGKLGAEIVKVKEQALLQQLQINSTRFGLERFGNDANLLNLYTGFKANIMLNDLFHSLEPKAKRMTTLPQKLRTSPTPLTNPKCEKLQLIDQLFLFLYRIQLGLFEQYIAVRFNISTATASRILITWANILHVMLHALPISRCIKAVKSRILDRFKKTYPNTHVICDCTEFRVQRRCSKV